MNLLNLNTVRIAGLSPDRLIVANGTDGLSDSSASLTDCNAALVSGDASSYEEPRIASLHVSGVTALNSDSGTLLWSVSEAGGVLTFSLYNDLSTIVASGSSPANPGFPVTVSLSEVSGSGVTGSVVLASASPASVDLGRKAHVPLPHPSATVVIHGDDQGPDGLPQIRRLLLDGVTTENSDDGKLYWVIVPAEGGLEFRLLQDASTVVAAGAVPPSFIGPYEVWITERNGSGIRGAAVLNSRNITTPMTSQWAIVTPETPAWIVGDEEQENIDAVILRGVTSRNSREGILDWTYAYRDGALWFFVHDRTRVVASGSLEGAPSFPCEIVLSPVHLSGVSGSVRLVDDSELSEGYVEQVGRLIVKAPAGVAFPDDLDVSRNLSSSGGVRVADDAALSDAMCGALHAGTLAPSPRAVLAADSTGRLTIMRPMADVIYAQYSSPAIELDGSEGVPVSLFPSGPLLDSGSRTIPAGWWEDGKRLSVKMAFAWAAPDYGADVKVSLNCSGSSIVLFDTALVGEPGDAEYGGEGGVAVIEVELIASRAGSVLDLRGYCRLDNDLYPVVAAGNVVDDYTFDVTVTMSDVDGYSYVVPYSAVMTAYEPPQAGGLDTGA